LRQQTKLLMNSFQTSNKRANINEVCRRRRIDDFKNKGEDHIVGKYDELLASKEALERENDVEINDKELLEEVYQNIKYRKRKMKRKSSSRILELWDLLACPPCSKLAFKLQSELPVPADVIAAMPSPSKNSIGNNNPPSITIISKLENLADSVHAMNVFVLLLRLWRERGYPDMYSSVGLMQPLLDVCRAGGFEKCVKKSNEEMREWLARLCDELWKVTLPQLRFWAAYSHKSLDQHFTTFVEDLHQDMCGFVAIFEEEKMMEDEKYVAKYSDKKVDRSLADVDSDGSPQRRAQGNVINTIVVTDLAPNAANTVTTEIISTEGDKEEDEEVETNVMKDKSVKYHTKNLSKKTQKIYESLPPIVDSVNINKVTKNLLKEPNKMLSKRLARVKAGLPADEEDDEKEQE